MGVTSYCSAKWNFVSGESREEIGYDYKKLEASKWTDGRVGVC